MNIVALRPRGVREWRAHSDACAGEVATLKSLFLACRFYYLPARIESGNQVTYMNGQGEAKVLDQTAHITDAAVSTGL